MSERLALLIYQRDTIEEALTSGLDYVEMTIRGRTVKKQASVKVLEYLNAEIDKETNKAAQRLGPARNRAELHR